MTQEQRKEERVQDRQRDRMRWIYPLILVFVSLFAVTGINIAYTTMAVQQNAQIWCEMVSGLDDQYQKAPPPTENGKVFAAQMHRIRVKLQCA